MNGMDERKQLHKDDRGSALAMIIVIIAFIAILASVLMFASYAGYKMRLVDKQGTNNFYTAETVLDEINVGLQREVSEALSVAYEEVMTNYSAEGSASERNQALRKVYFAELKNRLQMGADPAMNDPTVDPGKYSVNKLRSYLTDASRGDAPEDEKGSRKAFEEERATYGAIVESDIGADDDDSVSYEMDINNTRLLLKDLRVSYINQSGYVSMISTDVRIDLPPFTFAQAAAMPALETCSLIADDTLFLCNTTAGGDIHFKGDVYAGQIYIGDPSETWPAVRNNEKDGTVASAVSSDRISPACTPALATSVSFENLDGTETVNPALIISRNNIELGAGSLLCSQSNGGAKDSVELWGRNLNLYSATADLSGSVNLKDDLTLAGKGSVATLAGEYNGFGYLNTAGVKDVGEGEEESGYEGEKTKKEDGSTPDDAEDGSDVYATPDASSAIVINGRDSVLDLSALERLTICGRAYVATAYDKKNDADASEEVQKNKSNIMMGESLAVKSNQLIYLVPPEAIGCEIERDGTVGDSVFNCNPLTLEQYEEIISNDGGEGEENLYILLDGTKEIPELGNKKLNEYMVQEDVAGGGSAYVPEIIFQQTNAGTLVYLYMRFPDEDTANRYFRDYYGLNKESVDRYTKLYADDIKMAKDSLLYLNVAGNMLTYEGEEGYKIVSSDDSTANLSQAINASSLKDNTFASLCSKLVRVSGPLTLTEKNRTAFENIVDELQVQNVIDAKKSDPAANLGNDAVRIDTLDGTASMVLAGSPDRVYEVALAPDNARVIISRGDVLVNKDFAGLIIAKGSITVAAGADLTIEPVDINDFSNLLMTKVDELGQTNAVGEEVPYYLTNIFADGASYAYSGNAAYDAASSQVSLVDLITYERWIKK